MAHVSKDTSESITSCFPSRGWLEYKDVKIIKKHLLALRSLCVDNRVAEEVYSFIQQMSIDWLLCTKH